jgi:hypothetical protein
MPSSTESYFARGDESGRPWQWRCLDATGAELSPADPAPDAFPTQADAESWLGETWRDLLDAGVEQVTLLEGDREVYGPMSLRA